MSDDGATEGGEERGTTDERRRGGGGGVALCLQTRAVRSKRELPMQLEIDTRFVVLMMSSEKDFVCFDATCYHMGAPLLHADIEDLSRRAPCDAKDDEKEIVRRCLPVAPL